MGRCARSRCGLLERWLSREARRIRRPSQLTELTRSKNRAGFAPRVPGNSVTRSPGISRHCGAASAAASKRQLSPRLSLRHAKTARQSQHEPTRAIVEMK